MSVAVDGDYGKAHILSLSFPCLEVGAIKRGDILMNERTGQACMALTHLGWDKKVAAASMSDRPRLGLLRVTQDDRFIRVGEIVMGPR